MSNRCETIYSIPDPNKVYFKTNFDLLQLPAASWRDTLTCVMAHEPPSPEELPLAYRYFFFLFLLLFQPLLNQSLYIIKTISHQNNKGFGSSHLTR